MAINTVTDLAWAAGFIDADGTITIRRQVRATPRIGHPIVNIQHQALVQVGQRDYPEQRKSIEKLKNIFGGSISYGEPTLPGKNRMIVWRVASQKASDCLKQLYSYLVTKKLNADIVLEFHNNKVLSAGPVRVPPEEMLRREQLWTKVHELNQKGVVKH